MGFLPQGYEPPASGNYMKFKLGENRIRIITDAIVGNVFWSGSEGDRKPVRRRLNEVIEASELGIHNGEREKVKHFWAFGVWADGAVRILEVTQAGIRDSIESLCMSSDWGDPKGYDLLITKKGSGLDTTYTVMPGQKSPLPADAQKAIAETPLNLDALYSGGDPFAPATPGKGNNGSAKPTGDLAAARVACREAFVAEAGDPGLGAQNMTDKAKELFPGKKSADYTLADWKALTVAANDLSEIPF